MMKRAGRVHGLRGLGVAIATLIVAAMVLYARHRIDEDRQATIADNLVQRLLVADTTQVPDLVRAVERYRRWTDPALKRIVADPARSPGEAPCQPGAVVRRSDARPRMWKSGSPTPGRRTCRSSGPRSGTFATA